MADLQKEENTKENTEIGNKVLTTTRTSLFQRLAARFGFGIQKPDKKSKSSFRIINKLTDYQFESKGPKEEIDLINQIFKDKKLSSTVQELFDEWVNDTQNTYANIQEREERLNSLTYMCDNEGIVKSAVSLTASEVASLTENNAFTVISEDEDWQNETNYLLNNIWKYNQPTIYSLAWDIFLYGEAFQGREVSSAGIISINTLKPNEVIERLEFKPSAVANFNIQAQSGGGQSSGFTMNLTTPTNGGFGQSNLNFNFNNRSVSYKSTDNLLRDYIQNITDISSTEYFTPHLLGYRIFNDMLVAPWQISHFRFNAEVSEFWPYGQPQLLSCLSAYKQLQRVMGLDDLKSLLSMPIYMYKVKTNGATTARAFDIVNDVKEDFENVGLMSSSAGIEGPSLCTNIWTSDDLVTIEKVNGESTGDNASTDKMKFFYQRLATATGIPMSYLDPSSENFQMSGVALSALFKPFRTLVDNIRGIIISEVEDSIRLHDSIRGVKTPDFVLSMNVVSPVATEDMSSKLQLADSVMDTITNLLGLSDKAELPQTIKQDILTKYTNLTNTELENYINTLKKEGKSTNDSSEEVEESDFTSDAMESGEDEMEETPEENENEEEVEESVSKKDKMRLVEEEYRSARPELYKYYLTEKLGKLQLRNSTNYYCQSVNSRNNEEVINFIKERKTMKHGKKSLRS